MSRSDLKDAYRCGEYHRRGLKACTSHHIRVDKLDEVVKAYVRKVKENSAGMLDRLNADLAKEQEDVGEAEQAAEHLGEILADLQEELKATKRQRIRDIMKHPESEETLEETYDELETDLLRRMDGLQNQIAMAEDRRNTIIQVNRAAKTAMEVFDDILKKPKLERNDLELMLERIDVFEDHVEVRLKADVDAIIKSGSLPEESGEAANFKSGIADSLQFRVVQSSSHRLDKVYDVNVISNGDPLEIYTDRDGGVIFKKYSQMSSVSEFAAQLCEAMTRATGYSAVITDRDTCVAASGSGKRELLEKRVSRKLEQVMENRQSYHAQPADLPVCEDGERYLAGAAVPILAEGDVLGCVLLLGEGGQNPAEADLRTAQTVAGFLGKHMEH